MSDTRAHDLTGQVDGVANVFTTPDVYIAGTLIVEWNGSRLQPGVGYTELTSTTFRWEPRAKQSVPAVGDTILVQYEIDGPPQPFELVEATGIPYH